MKILNYQGNKNKLLKFIDKNISPLLVENKALLDIFSGGASVSAFFGNKTKVISNDLEPYAYHIANYYLNNNEKLTNEEITTFKKNYNENKDMLFQAYSNYLNSEPVALKDKEKIVHFYKSIPTLWNSGINPLTNEKITIENIKNRRFEFCLFTLLYSSNYFGLLQAIEIDSLVAAINKINKKKHLSFLYVCLFSTMNSCVFSKDGHMAQPLNIESNIDRCIKKRKVSVENTFFELIKDESLCCRTDNKSYNYEFEELLSIIDPKEIGCIYADPPYTDMQYSRYYHLLNTACEYIFENPTIKKNGYSSGLYLNNRRSSQISAKKTFIPKMRTMLTYAKKNNINVAISFGYPNNKSNEKTDRYLTSIDELSDLAKEVFGSENVNIVGQDYQHSNQRNSVTKKVIEYLIICRG